MELSFRTTGSPHAPAIMLLHGFMSSNAQWLANEQALSRRHFLVMVELWGHGDSPLPDESAFSTDEYIRQFERIREQLGLHRWALIGQSYGAGLTVHYALRHPERCSALIVTNSRSAFGRLRADRPGEERRAPKRLPASDVELLRRLPYHPINARRFPEYIKQALVESADRMDPAVITRGARLSAELDCTERLARVQASVLLTNGLYERSFQKDLAWLRERHPDLEVADLQGGHSVNIEAAPGFNSAVLAFLEKNA